MPYTTAELIAILDEELRASWQGRRQLLNPGDRIQNSVVSKALDPRRLSQIFAYQDFVAEVHAYQHEHQVSGLQWRSCVWRECSVDVPERHPQLTAIASDKDQLCQAKTAIATFWHQATVNLAYWQVKTHFVPLSAAEMSDAIATAEWLEVDATRTALYLGCCWGDPSLCHHSWAYPESGCTRLVAAESCPDHSLKV